MLGIFHNEKEERTLRWIISVKFFSFTWLLYIIQHFGCFFYTDKIDLDDSLRIYVIPISFFLESSNTHTHTNLLKICVVQRLITTITVRILQPKRNGALTEMRMWIFQRKRATQKSWMGGKESKIPTHAFVHLKSKFMRCTKNDTTHFTRNLWMHYSHTKSWKNTIENASRFIRA